MGSDFLGGTRDRLNNLVRPAQPAAAPGKRTLTDAMSPMQNMAASVQGMTDKAFDVGGRLPAPNEHFKKVLAYGVAPTAVPEAVANMLEATFPGVDPGMLRDNLASLEAYCRLTGWSGAGIVKKHPISLDFRADVSRGLVSGYPARVEANLHSHLYFSAVVPTGTTRKASSTVKSEGSELQGRGTRETSESTTRSGGTVPFTDITFGRETKNVSEETSTESEGKAYGEVVTAETDLEEFEVTVFLFTEGVVKITDILSPPGGREIDIGESRTIKLKMPPLHLGRFRVVG